jgi:hypothetical protein
LAILIGVGIKFVSLFRRTPSRRKVMLKNREHYYSVPIDNEELLLDVNQLIKEVFGDDTVDDDNVVAALARNELKSIALFSERPGPARKSTPELIGVASCWPVRPYVYAGMKLGNLHAPRKPEEHPTTLPERDVFFRRWGMEEPDIAPEDILCDDEIADAEYLYVPVIVIKGSSSLLRGRRAVALVCEFLAFVRNTYRSGSGRRRTIFLIAHSDTGKAWAERLGMGGDTGPTAYPEHFGEKMPFFERKFGSEIVTQTLIIENRLLREFAGIPVNLHG